MPRPRPNESTSCIDGESLRVLLALALGRPLPETTSSWSSLLSLATRERVVGVIWSRSAAVIRANAPPEVASLWQRSAVHLGLHARRQLEELAVVVAALTSRNVPVVVLKGAPLAQCLYGDFTVRPTLDSDLFVPIDHRPAAAHALGEIGWRRMSAQWPEEEKFEREDGRYTFVLEVHSSPIDDASLDHIRLPVEHRSVSVGGHTLPAQDGRFVAAFLATHLLKHHEKPLLWSIDFTVLWSSLDEAQKTEALRAAREVGLQRHLKWAIRLATDILDTGSAASATQATVQRVQRTITPMSDLGRIAQLVLLSASPLAAFRVLSGRLWPAAWRQGWRAAPAYFSGRAVRWAYRHLVFERPVVGSDSGAEPTVSFRDADCATRLRSALSASRAVWVSDVGQNMAPAIPPYGLARIASPDPRRLDIGDVVVIRSVAQQCMLERVSSVGEDTVRVKSDAHTREHSVSREAIVGVCDMVQVGDERIPIAQRPFGNLGMVWAIVRSRICRPSAAVHQVRS